jgi:hypothetical protein
VPHFSAAKQNSIMLFCTSGNYSWQFFSSCSGSSRSSSQTLFFLMQKYFHVEKLRIIKLPIGTNAYSQLTGASHIAGPAGPGRSQYFLTTKGVLS